MKKLRLVLMLAVATFLSAAAFAEKPSKQLLPIAKQELEFNLSGFGNYLLNGNAHQVEGVYVSPDKRYVIALVKNQERSHDYIGIVISADNPYWERGEVKFNFVKQADNSMKGYYYDSQGNPFPVEFKTDENGLKTKLLNKLSASEVSLSNLAQL